MESIQLGFNVIFPLVLMTVLGVFLKKIRMLSDGTSTEMNRLVFRVLLPLQLFSNAVNAQGDDVWTKENVLAALFILAAVAVVLFLSLAICTLLKVEKHKKIIISQGIYRSNIILFGLSVCSAIYDGQIPGIATLMVLIVAPFYNLIAVLLFESLSDKPSGFFGNIVNIFKTPIIIATVIGLLFNIFKLHLPDALNDTVQRLANMATPLAFITLGSSLKLKNIKKHIKAISIVTVLRLIIVPFAVLGISVLMGIRGPTLAVFISTLAAPVSVTSYSMAKENEVESQLAGELVAVTTIVSGITLFLWIVIFNQLGML